MDIRLRIAHTHTFTQTHVDMYACRVINGLTQCAMVVYAPVWVDAFSPPGRITLWMAVLQAGNIFGVNVSFLSVEKSWTRLGLRV